MRRTGGVRTTPHTRSASTAASPHEMTARCCDRGASIGWRTSTSNALESGARHATAFLRPHTFYWRVRRVARRKARRREAPHSGEVQEAHSDWPTSEHTFRTHSEHVALRECPRNLAH